MVAPPTIQLTTSYQNLPKVINSR